MQSGLARKDDGTTVLTVIFEAGELDAYVDRAESSEQATPLETSNAPEPRPDTEQPAGDTAAE
jgi:hypothetical protein